MTIYHFGKTLDAIRGTAMVDCPTFKSGINHGQLRTAQKMFASRFPDSVKLRDAVAHSAELDQDLKSKKENAVGIWTIRNAYIGKKFVNTKNRKYCFYELSAESLAYLKHVRDEFYKPFDAFDLIHHRRDQL